MTEEQAAYEGWAIIELMGHRRLAGRVSEAQLAGAAFLRLDIPGYLHTEPTGEQEERGGATQFYSPQAVYCITPTTEEIARQVASRSHPRPAQQWEPEQPRDEETYEDLDGADVDDAEHEPVGEPGDIPF